MTTGVPRPAPVHARGSLLRRSSAPKKSKLSDGAAHILPLRGGSNHLLMGAMDESAKITVFDAADFDEESLDRPNGTLGATSAKPRGEAYDARAPERRRGGAQRVLVLPQRRVSPQPRRRLILDACNGLREDVPLPVPLPRLEARFALSRKTENHWRRGRGRRCD